MSRKNMVVRSMLMLTLVGVLVGLGGCRDDDKTSPTTPETPTVQDCGEFFCYTVSQTAGVTITADFTRHHLTGKPFGNWSVEVEWRSADRRFAQEISVPVVIDAAGIGTAHVPVDYVNAIFAQVNADRSLWETQPGLTLAFYPDEETWEYYQFD